MALLVNHEGSYKEPQKLWYLINGIWKEVINVFESPVQQEIALLDTERISQDQTVLALSTRIKVLQASLDGTDPTIAILTDPVEITKTQKLLEALNLQLEISRLEQVAITKELFEQKAQLEYKKLVLNGEIAIQKIIKVVVDPNEWGVIRLDPQSTLDERLEIAIQHDLGTDERIFNYGAVYYRLYKLDQSKPEDNLANLSPNFKRRLSNAAFLAGTLATNYIMTTLTVQKAFEEVNQFVNSGAKRIEDYLFSLKEQNKFILDGIEKVKENMVLLNEIVLSGDLPEMVIDGKIINLATKPELQKPLGDILLRSQKAESVDHLVSMKNLTDIAEGTLNINDLPNPSIYTNLSSNLQSLNEKTESVSLFFTNNTQLSNDLATGVLQFSNLNVIGSRKQQLDYSKNLFWSSPLGESTLAKAGSQPVYIQGFTSSGTYKFKTNQMVELSTEYIAIIQTILANTKVGALGITIGKIPAVRIIQSIEANTIILDKNDIGVEKETTSVNIVSSVTSNTKNTGPLLASFKTVDYGNHIVSVSETNLVDETNGIDQYLNCVKVNQNIQPHPAIPFVYENNLYTVKFPIHLDVEHPIINSLFYATTYEYPLNSLTNVDVEPYLYEFGIRQLNKDFGVATLVPPTLNIGTDNTTPRETFISVFKECSYENTISLSLPTQMPLVDGGLIKYPIVSFLSCSTENEVTLSLPAPEINVDSIRWFVVNAVHQPLSSQMESSVKLFNISEDNISIDKLNGYAQKTNYVTTGTSGTGIIKIKLVDQLDHDNYNEYNSLLKEKILLEDNSTKYFTLSKQDHNYLSSQTGLAIGETFDIEFINTLIGSAPKISSVTGVGSTDLSIEHIEYINAISTSNPLISTNTTNKLFDTTIKENSLYENINVLPNIIPLIATVVNSSIYLLNNDNQMDYINKDTLMIPLFAQHLNPGVILS